MNPSTQAGGSQPPGRLISHFLQRNPQEHGAGWSELWDSDQSDLWDRGRPSPALVDFIEKVGREHLILSPRPNGQRPKALVPGCGRGYDVVMLALHGLDAYGLEISQTAVDVANDYAHTEMASPSEENFSRPRPATDSFSNADKGSLKFVVGDFFRSDWEKECQRENGPCEERFDLIYDYTFLCALPPTMRRPWAERMVHLLSPSGILVCLEFPLYKGLNAQGPPWGLKGVYWNLLAEGGDGILHESDLTGEQRKGEEEAGHARQARCKRVLYYRPERTYKVGEGTDMVSVWKLV